MKSYPSIGYWNTGVLGTHVYAFDKLDGSNLRAEFTFKSAKNNSFGNGFDRFGTKNQIIGINFL